ncbi:MAG: DKNYY domain-containing protein, partial [Rikenellaceae bacterium]|nr:DKNYY domain-containing protein [Rikenellaceae bacterium]
MIGLLLSHISCGVWNLIHEAPADSAGFSPASGPPTREGLDPFQEYFLVEGKMYYQDIALPDVRSASFIDLGGGYAKDSRNVYYRGRKIEASADSFEVVGRGYGKDRWHTYLAGEKVSHGVGPSREYFRGGYSKDSWRVYYQGQEVVSAQGSSFQDLGGGYGKDHWRVYYRGQEIRNASAASFDSLGGGYGKDNWRV